MTEHIHVQGNGADGLGAIRSLSGTSSISQSLALDNTTQFGVNPSSQLTIVNDIYVGAGTPGLTKSGGGTLVLSGNNSYTGTTTVFANSGELIINGNTSGQGNYFINSDSRLGGNGTIGLAAGNSVWISGSPGELSPGYASTGPFSGESYSAGADINTVGSLGVVGDVDLGGSLLIDLMSSDQDQLNVVGDFAILAGPNALLEINGMTDLTSVDFWGILGWTTLGQSIDLVTFSTFGGGAFANIGFNQEFTDAGGRNAILGLDGDSIFLMATPEPASIVVWSLIGFSVIGCGWKCAKRKR
jgi:autotransporter-associated beta strand protein